MSGHAMVGNGFGTGIRGLIGIALTASLLACGGGGTSVGSESGDEPAATAAAPAQPAIDVTGCAGFDTTQAAAILDVAADDLEASSSRESWGTDCNYVPKGDEWSDKAVRFTLSRSESVDEATEEMAQLASHSSVADEVQPGEHASHWVQGVGDEALWAAANDSLYVRSGDVTVIVTQPKDQAKQIEVARRIIG